MRLITASAVLGAILASSALALTESWSVDVRVPSAVQRTVMRGESATLQITLRDGLAPLALTNATAVLYWYTNSTANLWWTNAASVSSSTVTAAWTPSMDVGASLYPYWIGIWPSGSTSPIWRVSGSIRVLGSPGLNPNTLPLPVFSLDFSTIAYTNAPWLLPAATNDLSISSDASGIVIAAGGWTISNYWEPILTAVYRSTSAATSYSTNSYLIYATSLAEAGMIDWALGYRVLDGWPPPPTWTITAGSNYAYVASNRVWGITPGRASVQGVADGVTRTVIAPINYGKIATPVTTLLRLLPGSPAATATLPIIAMASNYLATTTEPLVARPSPWNTNETFRTNYAAVVNAAWNTNCWLTNAPALFSCTAFAVGTSPTASSLWHGTLISPRIIVKARHVRYNLGQTHWFLTPDGSLTNAVLSRWIDLYPDGGPDLVLGVLDRAMPTSMVARVATTAQIAAAFPAPTGYGVGSYVHAVAFNQHLDASLLQLHRISATTEWQTYWNTPTLPQSAALGDLYHPAHPGDSGCPIILAWGNTPVLLSLYYFAGSGSSISASIPDIAAALAAEGEALTYIDFGGTP